MTSIKNVAIIGGAGNLGGAVLKALVDDGFNVTALTRENTDSKFPGGVRVHKTDYNSDSSLESAFKDQDAVVSVIATTGLITQLKIIEVAAKSGVKRFIPSEFGVNVEKLEELEEGSRLRDVLGAKVKAGELLKKLSSENKDFTWTGISTNLFFDWGLKHGSLGLNLSSKSATIYDSGNEPFTGTNLGAIGAAVASVLKHPAETANKYIDISSFRTTQNEILAIAEEESSSKWDVTHVQTDNIKSLGSFADLLKVHTFRDGEGKSPKEADLSNDLLGLQKEDLKETIKKALE
ncbi:Isoflavone reductase-like protein P3 [Lachnellula suecica]|uniref:Isoflavone reductase-like protein P3 n=1 Tax=Lachnellula suecica TaxID=602035 RepID=A0A8T9C099_9HELO|nr:Isoflavone reductase-like protein P3 [Lachnellula suecica]